MDITTLTKEQQAALKLTRESSRAFYDHEQTIIDQQTGEILKSTRDTIRKTSGEPDYVKLYYKTMMAFQGVEGIPLSFIMSMASHMTWSNDGQPITFENTKLIRETICRECNIGDVMCKKYITRCRECGILFPRKGYRGAYEVNPWLIAKGKWDSLKQLRTTFDFIDGHWERTIVTDEEPTDE